MAVLATASALALFAPTGTSAVDDAGGLGVASSQAIRTQVLRVETTETPVTPRELASDGTSLWYSVYEYGPGTDQDFFGRIALDTRQPLQPRFVFIDGSYPRLASSDGVVWSDRDVPGAAAAGLRVFPTVREGGFQVAGSTFVRRAPIPDGPLDYNDAELYEDFEVVVLKGDTFEPGHVLEAPSGFNFSSPLTMDDRYAYIRYFVGDFDHPRPGDQWHLVKWDLLLGTVDGVFEAGRDGRAGAVRGGVLALDAGSRVALIDTATMTVTRYLDLPVKGRDDRPVRGLIEAIEMTPDGAIWVVTGGPRPELLRFADDEPLMRGDLTDLGGIIHYAGGAVWVAVEGGISFVDTSNPSGNLRSPTG